MKATRLLGTESEERIFPQRWRWSAWLLTAARVIGSRYSSTPRLVKSQGSLLIRRTFGITIRSSSGSYRSCVDEQCVAFFNRIWYHNRNKFVSYSEGGTIEMEQGSEHLFEEEEDVALNCTEHARIIEYLRAVGLTDEQINDMWIYVADGGQLPTSKSDDNN